MLKFFQYNVSGFHFKQSGGDGIMMKPSLLVSALFSHGLGQLSDGSQLRLTLLFLLLSVDGVHTQFPTARGAQSRSGTSSLDAPRRRLPTIQQGLVAGKLVQQRVTGDSSAVVSVEDWEKS